MKGNNEMNTAKILVGCAGESQIKEFLHDVEQQEGRFEEYIIAYIDFLGIKNRILDKSINFLSLKTIQFILNNAVERAAIISDMNMIGNYDIKVFSDNVVIAQKVREERIADQLNSIVNLVSLIQFEAYFQFDIPLRGGITIGELYIDNSIVWGEGLIDAYNMESVIASFPRVIVSKKALDAYEKCDSISLNLYALLELDFDGAWFVNFFLAVPNLELIPEMSACLQDKASSCNTDIRAIQKINWVISHFNQMCHKYKDRGDYEKYTIPYISFK